MNLLAVLLQAVLKLAAPVVAFFWALREKKIERLEDEKDALEAKIDTAEAINSMSPESRRKLMRAWEDRSLSGIPPNPSNDK